MQNVQNADILRVMNLVNLYRRKVGWESQIAKEAKADYDYWDSYQLESFIKYGDGNMGYGDGPHTKLWIKHLKVNEQLLGHFYVEVAGKDADNEILSELLPDFYDKTIFTEEEESFLKNHFKEMVNYIIVTPNDESLKLVNRYDNRDAFVIPNEVLELISNRVKITKGSRIFNPNTGFAQFTNLYKDCKFFCDDKNAWMQIAIYANNADVEIVEENSIPVSYDAIVSYLPHVANDSMVLDRLCEAYHNLSTGSMFLLICPSRILADEEHIGFREMLVKDRAIKEIIQLPQVMSDNASFDTYSIIVAEKGRTEKTTTFIDARFAHKELDNRHYMLSFDNEAFHAVMQNNGVDPLTDRRSVIRVPSHDFDERILLPQVFVLERPSEKEHPIPLADICTMETKTIRSLLVDLPMDTPWIKETDLSYFYKGELDVAELEKAECPNNPPHTEDYTFDGDGEFSDHLFSQRTPIGRRVQDYRACTYVDGKSGIVLYKRTPEDGVCTAILRATGNPVAISKGISVFCPKKGFEALSLLALLRHSIVFRQILAYKDFGLNKFLNDILVPTNKILIKNETYRMDRELSMLKEQQERFSTMKTEYINEVRMRKHDMRPHMKQLNSAKNLMQHYVDNMDKIDDVKQHLCHQLTRFHDALNHLSDLIEHLSDEEKFGEPERFSITDYFKKLVSELKNSGYDIEYFIDSVAIENYLKVNVDEYIEHTITLANVQDEEFKKRGYTFPMHWSYAMIAPLDFDRMVQNILENARKHGFTDSARSDYKVWIVLSVDEKRNMYVIDFKNNGTRLPKGMTKERYGIRGEKAGLNGGTGSGGYIVKSIVTHYGGDYDIFYNDENKLTTVRVYLPIATI